MFKPIGSGVLDKECEQGLLSHLNEDEFLSAYGLHSLSKRDPAYDPKRQFAFDVLKEAQPPQAASPPIRRPTQFRSANRPWVTSFATARCSNAA